MTTYAPFGSTPLGPSAAPLPEDTSIGGEASKGFSRGLRDAGANLAQAGGLGAEALGFNGAATSLRGTAADLRHSAEAFAPESQDWAHVHGLGQALRWGAGKVGEMAPVVGEAAIGTALTGNPFVGGTLAMTPNQIGQIDQEQQADPTLRAQAVGDRALRAGVYGVGSAAAMSAPIGGVLGKGLGKSFLGNVAQGAVTGAAGMGGADVLTQQGVNPNTPTDWGRAGEAALDGGVTMGAMHVPSGAVAALGGRARAAGGAVADGVGSVYDAAKAKVGGAVDAAAETAPGQKVADLYDRASEAVQKGVDNTSSLVNKVMNGEPLGVDPVAYAQATGAKAKEMFDFSNNEAVKAASEWANQMLTDKGLTPERRAAVVEAMGNIKEEGGAQAMAALKKVYDLGKAAVGQISNLADTINKKYGVDSDFMKPKAAEIDLGNPTSEAAAPKPTINDRKAFMDDLIGKGATKVDASAAWDQQIANANPRRQIPDPPKFSLDYSDTQQAILRALQDSGLGKRRPELFENSDAINKLGSSLRVVLDQMSKGPLDPEVVSSLHSVLGRDTDGVINTLRRALASTDAPDQNEAYFKNLNALTDVQNKGGDIGEQLHALMTPEAQAAHDNIHDMSSLTGLLTAHANGEHMRGEGAQGLGAQGLTAKDTAVNNAMREVYRQRFGENADDAAALVQKHVKQKAKDTAMHEAPVKLDEAGNMVEDSEGGFDEQGNRVDPAPRDQMKFGLTAPDVNGKSKSVINGAALKEGSPYAKQHLMDLKAKYPEHDVRFERMPGEDGYGHIVVEKRDNPGEFNDADLAAMKHNTKDYSASPSKLKVGEYNLDAMRIASTMRAKMRDKFEKPTPANYELQTVEAFKEGVAQLMEQFGTFPIPDNARIGTVGNKPLLWGEAQRVVSNSAEDRMSKSGKAKLAALREAFKGTAGKERNAILKQVQDLMDFEKARELGDGDMRAEPAGPSNFAPSNGEMGPRGEVVPDRNAPRARSQRRQNADAYYDNEVTPFDGNNNPNYDAGGNLTKAGAMQLLSGNDHGGINVRDQGAARDSARRSYNAEQAAGGIPRGKEGIRQQNRDRRAAEGTFDRSGAEADFGQSRTEIGKDDQIHLAAAGLGDAGDTGIFNKGVRDGVELPKKTGKELMGDRRDTRGSPDLQNNSNMDGSGQWVNPNIPKAEGLLRNKLTQTVMKWADTSSAPAKKIVARAEKLKAGVDMMSAADKRRFYGLADQTVGEAAQTINELAKKYADRIVAPGKEVRTGATGAADAGVRNQAGPLGKPGTLESTAARERRASELNVFTERTATEPRLTGSSMDLGDGTFVTTGLGGERMRQQTSAPGGDAVRATKAAPLEAAIAKRQAYLDNPPADYTPDAAQGHMDWARSQLERVNAEYDKVKGGDNYDLQDKLSDRKSALGRLITKAKSVLEGDASLAGFEGSAPSPKAVAAKKAALTERALSGDKALHEELAKSDDAKGLQRAAEHLAATAPDSEALKIANDRLTELVKDPDVALGLQTRKYSYESTVIHDELGNEGFAATHDSPNKHEGVFDWRSHQGKGEGNASFGAGTYLSTADGVHESYKKQFSGGAGENFGDGRMHDALLEAREGLGKGATPEDIREYAIESLKEGMSEVDDYDNQFIWDSIRELKRMTGSALTGEVSPTYHVSVDIKPEHMMDWNKPMSEQSAHVKEALSGLVEKDLASKLTGTYPLPEHQRVAWGMDSGEIQTLSFLGDKKLTMVVGVKNGKPMVLAGVESQGKVEWGRYPSKDEALARIASLTSGGRVYEALAERLGSQAKASDALQKAGILGHTYDAAGGRGTEFRNHVIYDDSKIKTNYVKFDRSTTDPLNWNTAQRAAVEAHIDKVLGKTAEVQWKNLSHAGDFTKMSPKDIIRLSVHALNPMSTAFHESFHGFIGKMRDAGAHDVIGVLEKAASSEGMLRQLEEKYKNQPEVLRQLKDPEERVAYMYQHWAMDPAGFKTSISARNMFQRISDFIHKTLGLWTNDERALHIMDYFHQGEYARDMSSPSAMRANMMETHRSSILETAKSFTEPLLKMADSIVGTGGARLRDTGIPSINRLADILKRDHLDDRGGDRGFIPESRAANTKSMNALGAALGDATEVHLHDAMESLQSGIPSGDAATRHTAAVIKNHLQGLRDYMVKAGVNVGDLGPDYFPRVWDTHYISKNRQAFRDMLEPYIRSGEMKGSADGLLSNLITRGGGELGIESRESTEPGMQFGKQRLLDFIKPEDSAQFMEKDLMKTLSSYTQQATRKAEWTRRLGGGKLEALLVQAKKEGATKDDLDLAEKYMKGVDGTLGDGMNPTLRRITGNMIVYQNIRLLPTAAFSMLIDPAGTVVRGGSVRDAFSTFKRGMVGITKTFSKDGEAHDEGTRIAELTGVVESAMVSHAMGDVFSQGMVGGTAQKMNNFFFKANFVEGLNRNFRIGATEASLNFLAHHADGKASPHSVRFMKELGIEAGDIKKRGDRIALTEAEGLSPEQVGRVHSAINQWVDGAILRPDAADKPIYFNDPRFALISHLKQFVFSFQKTILARVMHEVGEGNYTPAMALASYVPIMMAADFAKGMLVNAGGQPSWQAGWGPADYLENGIERAGLYGVGQFGVDVMKNIHRGGTGLGALAGPTFEQFGDVISTLGGKHQFGNTVIDALPANTFIKGWFNQGDAKPDPNFGE